MASIHFLHPTLHLRTADEYDETRTDFSRWKGTYETWQRRKEAYREKITRSDLLKVLRFQPAY